MGNGDSRHDRVKIDGVVRARKRDQTGVQMMAWGSLAREVPRRNFRRRCLVSSEKV